MHARRLAMTGLAACLAAWPASRPAALRWTKAAPAEPGHDFMAKSKEAGKPFFIRLSWNAMHASENALEATLAKDAQRLGSRDDRRTTVAAITEDLDTGVGRVLTAIDRLGLAGTTDVISTSDKPGKPGKPVLKEPS